MDETSGAELGIDMLGGMMLGTIDPDQVLISHDFTISAAISGSTISVALSAGTISAEMTVNET